MQRQTYQNNNDKYTNLLNMEEREIFLTKEEKELIAKKTGFSTYTVDQVLRKRRPANRRHTQIFEMYNKLVFLRKIHNENYKKDIEAIENRS